MKHDSTPLGKPWPCLKTKLSVLVVVLYNNNDQS
jgi:hypothetical protein